MYNYSRSNNISFFDWYKTTYENMVGASTMNTTLILIQAIEEIQILTEQILESDETPNDIALNTTEIDDWKNIAAFEGLSQLKMLSVSQTKNWDWSTEAVGSLFIKNLKYFLAQNLEQNCEDSNTLMKLVNDLFTLPKYNLSLPNIALIYTTNNFRLIDTSNDIEDNPQNLTDCLIDMHTNSIFVKEAESFDFGSRYNIHQDVQYLEPSPCLNLQKFPRCNKYCTWHHNFFEVTPKSEFLTSMTYAIPQRKIRYISVKYAKNNEYIVISKINISLLNLAWNNLLQKKFYLRGLWEKRA